MSSIEIKQELHKLIDSSDDKFVKMFYEMAKAYTDQLQKEKMVSEGEKDIISGRTFGLKEAKKWLTIIGSSSLTAITNVLTCHEDTKAQKITKFYLRS